ncbi:peroxiredoxin family protein [Zunongwangia endophytica]|uniref:Peroxiredoxin family protein n=1 Tax=Zunongwangia endophytica TaxID=1808945 RepID=A0ABV8HEK7_9FLAO|nr:thioredoxin-like domain-containing protein [Zunongwangia endophytica]MDN3593480.1 thioredoxin-like domain-containing protein [Zunongwangia endophytica]
MIIAIVLGSCKEKEKRDLNERINTKRHSDSLMKTNLASKINFTDTIKKAFKGTIAPDFKLETVSGSEFQLSSIEDKIIILDFWGSWCVPCLRDFPKMKEYYNRYKSKIEIIGITNLDSKKNWKLSVKKHKLEWINVINEGTSDPDLTYIYGVESFPTKFILDKDRKIIGIYGTTDDFYTKIDELIRNSE